MYSGIGSTGPNQNQKTDQSLRATENPTHSQKAHSTTINSLKSPGLSMTSTSQIVLQSPGLHLSLKNQKYRSRLRNTTSGSISISCQGLTLGPQRLELRRKHMGLSAVSPQTALLFSPSPIQRSRGQERPLLVLPPRAGRSRAMQIYGTPMDGGGTMMT